MFNFTGERTDNKNIWGKNTETKVITSFTANQRTPSVKRDLCDINKTPETVSSKSKSNGCPNRFLY